MGDVLRLLRAHNLLVAAIGVVAGGWIALGEVATPKVLVFAAVAAVGFGAAGNALNDLWDVAADRVNHAAEAGGKGRRPLASGRLTRSTAEFWVFAGALVGLMAAALVNGRAVLVGLAALGVMIAYSPFLKRRGVIGNVAIAVVAGLPLYYGALAVAAPAVGLVPWSLAAWLHLGREMVKDLDDEEGDRLLGRRTLPIALGRSRAAGLAALTLETFVLGSLVVPWRAGYRDAYFPVAAIAQVIVVLAAARLHRGRTHGVSRWLKVAMVVGITALVLGKTM